MESGSPPSRPSADLVFEGAQTVVVSGGQHDFRPLASPGGRQVFLHGSVVGESLGDFAQRKSFSDACGRFLVLVHDAGRRQLEIHTDRHGVVPFYRTSARRRLVLSTRIESLVRAGTVAGQLDPAGLADLLCFQLALGSRTLVRDVANVPPGCHRVGLDDLEVEHDPMWTPEALLREPGPPYESVRGGLVERFLEATRRCTEGASQVAVTLSGGMDTRCLLAASLHLGRPTTACQVAVPGSRAERYARRIAEVCQVPLRAHALDAGFAGLYHDLVARVSEASEGMKFVPQPEMLWLRDRVETPAVVLHGAFGELAKLGVLRDFRIDEAARAASPGDLEPLLWRRFEDRQRSHFRLLAPDVRAELEKLPREHLRGAVDAVDDDLGVAEKLQVLYFREFVKSARYGHQIWNERVPTHFPFLDPSWVDGMLRVASAERYEQRFQVDFLDAVDPRLRALPDENTGAAAGAPRLWNDLVRAVDLVRIVLFDSKVEANHGDLLSWIHGMEPSPETIVQELAGDPFYDRDALVDMIAGVRRALSASGPTRAFALRRARRDAAALQAFLLVALFRAWLDDARTP